MKLILGFLIPALMILMVGFWTSFQIRTLSRGVEDILKNNDRSIQYALNMDDALSTIDKVLLMKIRGDTAAFDSVLLVHKQVYNANLADAKNNITEAGEEQLLAALEMDSQSFFKSLDAKPKDWSFDAYISDFFPKYELTKAKIDSLRLLNSKALYNNALKLTSQSQVVALPGDVLVVIALIFFLLFAWLTYRYITAPIHTILKAVKKYNASGEFTPPLLQNKDELTSLTEEIKKALKR